MKSFFVSAALFAAVFGAPLVEDKAVNGTESNLDVGPGEVPEPRAHVNLIFTSETPEPVESKRSVEVEERGLEKRATVIVDVWQDINRGGRHEGLWTDTQRCYNLGNGWNDAISSLQTPPNVGCYFYWDNDCPSNGRWLSISKSGDYVFLNAPDWGYNDVISSYLCWD